MSLLSHYQQKTTKHYQNFLLKGLKDTKIQQMNVQILESNFARVNQLFVLVYSNQDSNSKSCKAKGYYLPIGILKNYNVIINRKNFYKQPIDSDIKR